MADNLNITSGSGVVVATDDIASVHYQRIKLVDGNLDSTSAVGVATNPLFVNVSNSTNIVSVSNTSATISILNTSNTIYVLNTGAAINILNTNNTIYVLNTGASINVLNTRTSVTVSGSVTSLMTGGVTLLSSIPLTITGTTLVSGGVTLLSSIPLAVKQGVRDYLGCTSTWIYAALSSNNATSVWIPAANKRFNITDIVVNCTSASTVTITQDTAATITIMKLKLMDRGGWVSNFQTPIIASLTNHALVVTSTESGTNSYICISGYESA